MLPKQLIDISVHKIAARPKARFDKVQKNCGLKGKVGLKAGPAKHESRYSAEVEMSSHWIHEWKYFSTISLSSDFTFYPC